MASPRSYEIPLCVQASSLSTAVVDGSNSFNVRLVKPYAYQISQLSLLQNFSPSASIPDL